MASRPDDPFAPGPDEDRLAPADFEFGRGVPPPFRLDGASVARIPLPAERGAPIPDAFIPSPYPPDRVAVHISLFVATLLTTTWVGATMHYPAFLLDFKTPARPLSLSWVSLLLGGLSYSLTILAILGAHEFGHYFACRYYRINASLPYFIPVPAFLTGTLGAFIKIRQPIWSKRQWFDVGVAGPFAGFIVAVPALVLGIALSHVAQVPKDMSGLELGEPLLFRLVTWMLWGHIPTGYSLNLHPVAFAAWFGLFATALNLIPFGQLDGGHVAYSVFGRASTKISFATLFIVIALAARTPMSWMAWAVIMVVMVLVFGARHPPAIDEHQPLGRQRMILAAAALAVFVLSFTPAPIDLFLGQK